MVSIFLSKVQHLGNTVHDFTLFCQPESRFIHYLLQLPDISQEIVALILTLAPVGASQVGWSKDAVGVQLCQNIADTPKSNKRTKEFSRDEQQAAA